MLCYRVPPLLVQVFVEMQGGFMLILVQCELVEVAEEFLIRFIYLAFVITQSIDHVFANLDWLYFVIINIHTI